MPSLTFTFTFTRSLSPTLALEGLAMRSILAVILGYLVFGVPSFLLFRLAGVDPGLPPSGTFFLLSVLYGIVFAVLAGYVTAWIAARDVLWPVLTVAALLALIAAASLAGRAGNGAIWSEISALALMAPAVVVGGAIRLRRTRRP